MVTEAARRGVTSFAKGTDDVGAAMNLEVQVLCLMSVYVLREAFKVRSYHLQIVLILEAPIARFAVMWPMTRSRHVLIPSIFRAEGLVTGLTFVHWGPVRSVVHVLVAGTLSLESLAAGLTFWCGAFVIFDVIE